ncbi:MAG: DUF512 domain-containing protein [Calditrichaeota bacterium]|nr:DUF512 domain-containing protein [Calditrichota bacterium]
MLKVERVERGGLAERLGLKPGDRLLAVNGEPVRDELDFQFYASDEVVELRVARDGAVLNVVAEREFGEPWGIEFAETRYRSCGNKCVFCFIDQNPQGLRPSLYFKDEDYRLSFLHGNYVTLTNVGRRDLERILRQHLSPLYVSVHATDPEVRKRLLGIDHDDRLLEKIEALVDGGIQLHAQIVLVPGYNDGSVLQDTLDTLCRYAPAVASVAVVPVGLTRHRAQLPQLRPVDARLATEVVQNLEEQARTYQRELGMHWIYLADEFYLRAGLEVPPAERYDDFPQIENGVGMLRAFLDAFEEERASYPRTLGRTVRVVLLTGRLAAPQLRRFVLPALQNVGGLDVTLVPVRNDFFGESVTVSGLLVGRDLAASLAEVSAPADWVLIPANTLNPDGLFLDNLRPEDLEERFGVSVLPLDGTFLPFFEKVEQR